MSRWFVLGPEVAGGLGSRTVLDSSTHPPTVMKLHYVLEDWLGDDLIESFPCFLVSGPAKAAIVAAGLTGCTFAPVEVSCSPEFAEMHPACDLPPFDWLQVYSRPFELDFGVTANAKLVVSYRALQVLRSGRLSHCDVSEVQAA